MNQTRRSIISALGLLLPLGLAGRARGEGRTAGPAPALRFRPFEDAVREAFAGPDGAAPDGAPDQPLPCRRIEVGHSEEVQAGVQGCHNDRPFAGFPAGHLRIVRAGAEPGRARGGVRLYVSTVDVALTGGRPHGGPSRPLDFSTLPPAPVLP